MRRAFAQLHPFLFAAYAVLALLSANVRQMPPADALRSLIAALVIAAVALLGLRLITGDWDRGGVLASLGMVLFFAYGHVYTLLQTGGGDLNLGRHRFLLPAWLGLFAALAWWAMRKLRDPRRLVTALNLTAAAALVLPCYSIGAYLLSPASPLPGGPGLEPPGPSTGSVGPLPDIYYIIVDAYARPDILRDVYGYDNSEFLQGLSDLGFQIATGSHSNYAQTSLSLASSLNLEYVPSLVPDLDADSQDLRPLGLAIRDSLVRRILTDLGYSTVAFASGYTPTEIQDADLYLAPDPVEGGGTWLAVNGFEGMLIQTSAASLLTDALTFLPERFRPDLGYEFRAHRERIEYALNALGGLPPSDRPRFVFLHLVSPHPPFVFGPAGEPREQAQAFTLRNGVYQGDRASYVERYADQVTYLNGRLLEVLGAIIEGSDPPPIILLQADHGPDATSVGDGPSTVSYLDERFSILSAYRLQGCDPGIIYPTITPVNSFRLVLRDCLGYDYPLIEDRSFLSAYGAPYQLREITEELR